MNWADIILLAILVSCAVFVAVRMIRRRKKGGSCGCSGCAGCAIRETCGAEKNTKKNCPG